MLSLTSRTTCLYVRQTASLRSRAAFLVSASSCLRWLSSSRLVLWVTSLSVSILAQQPRQVALVGFDARLDQGHVPLRDDAIDLRLPLLRDRADKGDVLLDLRGLRGMIGMTSSTPGVTCRESVAMMAPSDLSVQTDDRDRSPGSIVADPGGIANPTPDEVRVADPASRETVMGMAIVESKVLKTAAVSAQPGRAGAHRHRRTGISRTRGATSVEPRNALDHRMGRGLQAGHGRPAGAGPGWRAVRLAAEALDAAGPAGAMAGRVDSRRPAPPCPGMAGGRLRAARSPSIVRRSSGAPRASIDPA